MLQSLAENQRNLQRKKAMTQEEQERDRRMMEQVRELKSYT